MLCCFGTRGAEAAGEGQPRCRGGALRAWVQGSSSSFGALQRRVHPAAAGWIAEPCVSDPAHGFLGCSHWAPWGLQQRATWFFGRGVQGVFLPSLHNCGVQTSF